MGRTRILARRPYCVLSKKYVNLIGRSVRESASVSKRVVGPRLWSARCWHWGQIGSNRVKTCSRGRAPNSYSPHEFKIPRGRWDTNRAGALRPWRKRRAVQSRPRTSSRSVVSCVVSAPYLFRGRWRGDTRMSEGAIPLLYFHKAPCGAVDGLVLNFLIYATPQICGVTPILPGLGRS
jgi:hypothetical protein